MNYKGVFLIAVGLTLAGCQSAPQGQPTDQASSAAGDLRPGTEAYADMIRDTKPAAGPLHEVRDGVLSPLEAVVYASRAAPDAVEGTFGLQVRNFGYTANGFVFLNSEQNYREQINISVRIQPAVAQYLQRNLGDNWLQEIMGKDIEVEGAAVREVIYFNDSVRGRTNSYYYQTHIEVSHPNQITIL